MTAKNPGDTKQGGGRKGRQGQGAGKNGASGKKAGGEETELRLRLLRAQTETAELQAAQQRQSALAFDDPDKLVLPFYKGVTGETVADALAKLQTWERRFPRKAITIVLNSPGGSVFAGLALYDYLRFLSRKGHHITVITIGMAASMGGILLQAGDTRKMSANSMMLIHEVSDDPERGKVRELSDGVKLDMRLWHRLAGILTSRTGGKLTTKQLKHKAMRKDWWLWPEEAKELGLIDEIC